MYHTVKDTKMEFTLILLVSFCDQLFVNHWVSLNQSDMISRSQYSYGHCQIYNQWKMDELKLGWINKCMCITFDSNYVMGYGILPSWNLTCKHTFDGIFSGDVTDVYLLLLVSMVFKQLMMFLFQEFLVLFKELIMKPAEELMIKYFKELIMEFKTVWYCLKSQWRKVKDTLSLEVMNVMYFISRFLNIIICTYKWNHMME
eukprot:504933_1